MADITATPVQVAMVNETGPEIRTYIAQVNINAGQAVYVNASGKLALAQANSVASAAFAGTALRTVFSGQAVSVLQRGSVYGFDLSGVAYNGPVYLSAVTPGAFATAPATGTGNVVVTVGRVLPLSDAPTFTKVLFVDVLYGANALVAPAVILQLTPSLPSIFLTYLF